jgi:beta-lactamase class A
VRTLAAVSCAILLSLGALMAPRVATGQTAGSSAVGDELRRQVESRLRDIATGFDGVMGYSLVDLNAGGRIDVLADAAFPAASTIKLAILYELYRQVDAGAIRLDETAALDPRHVVGGTGVLFRLGTPVLSMRDYATLMIVLSDNTATNVVIDRVGMDDVNSTVGRLGLKRTRIRRRMMDLDAARRGEENLTSPGDLARILEVFWKGEGLSRGRRDEAMAILSMAKTTPMVRGVPAGIPVASKSGELDGVRADAGIVSAPQRPFIIAVMTTYAQSDLAAERAIEDASRAAYQYFSRIGTGGAYGRRIDR